ncbi:hypothetical protein C8R43DRAFT_1121761 [Mycena crocata]|nr:hypothetical protein C8R43DRAFT_1121761 [Mycena crocata]
MADLSDPTQTPLHPPRRSLMLATPTYSSPPHTDSAPSYVCPFSTPQSRRLFPASYRAHRYLIYIGASLLEFATKPHAPHRREFASRASFRDVHAPQTDAGGQLDRTNASQRVAHHLRHGGHAREHTLNRVEAERQLERKILSGGRRVATANGARMQTPASSALLRTTAPPNHSPTCAAPETDRVRPSHARVGNDHGTDHGTGLLPSTQQPGGTDDARAETGCARWNLADAQQQPRRRWTRTSCQTRARDHAASADFPCIQGGVAASAHWRDSAERRDGRASGFAGRATSRCMARRDAAWNRTPRKPDLRAAERGTNPSGRNPRRTPSVPVHASSPGGKRDETTVRAGGESRAGVCARAQLDMTVSTQLTSSRLGLSGEDLDPVHPEVESTRHVWLGPRREDASASEVSRRPR